MMKSRFLFLGVLLSSCLAAAPSFAQGFASGLFGIGQVVVNAPIFHDFGASQTCRLSEEGILSIFDKAFTGTAFPAVSPIKSRELKSGLARASLVTEIHSHVDEILGCVSWVSLSVEGRVVLSIPPIAAPRDITAVYWRTAAKAFSNQSVHNEKIEEVLGQMAQRLVRQYELSQPAALFK